jgi:Tfp pilus assembly protein PilN
MKHPVLAVFGHTIHFVSATAERSRQLPEGADLPGALLQLVMEAPERPRVLGLVYQPVDLQVVAAECANVSRPKLQAYFAGEHRELTNPATFWAATKPAPHLDGKYTTLLHYEQRPRLEHLLQLLEEQGIRVRVALPPAAALASRTRADRLELAILAAHDCHFFYHVNELGIPIARFGRNLESLQEHCGVALASRKHPPAHALVVADQPPATLIDLLETHGLRDQTRFEKWPEFLRGIPFLSGDPANFARRPFKWKSRHTLTAVAAVFALGAATLTYDYVSTWTRARHLALELERHRGELQQDVARLEATEKRYREAEALIASVPLANPKPSALLDAVTQALPPSLQLQAYRYQGGKFSLEGVAYEGIGQEKGPFATFAQALGNGSRPWVFRPPAGPLASSAWTLHGTINP